MFTLQYSFLNCYQSSLSFFHYQISINRGGLPHSQVNCQFTKIWFSTV
jgi:hypothetical protein